MVGAIAALALLRFKPPARDPQAMELLAQMRTAYSAVRSAQISCTCTYYEQGRKLAIPSTATFKAPNDFRIETSGVPGLTKDKYVEVCDGKRIHIDGLPGGSLDIPFSKPALVRNTPQINLEVLCFMDWQRQLSTDEGGGMHFSGFALRGESWNGKTWKVLRENARRQGVYVDYYVDPNTSLIWRTVQYDADTNFRYGEVAITKLTLNAPVDASLFSIAPAKKP